MITRSFIKCFLVILHWQNEVKLVYRDRINPINYGLLLVYWQLIWVNVRLELILKEGLKHISLITSLFWQRMRLKIKHLEMVGPLWGFQIYPILCDLPEWVNEINSGLGEITSYSKFLKILKIHRFENKILEIN